MKNDIKLCRVTGKPIDPIKSAKNSTGLFLSPSVKNLYLKNNRDLEKTKKDLNDNYYWINELNDYRKNWRVTAKGLYLLNLNKSEKEEIYNRVFKEKTKCRLIGCNKFVPYSGIELRVCCTTHFNQATSKKYKPVDFTHCCKECDMKYANEIALTAHITRMHCSSEEYYNTHLKKSPDEGKCLWCKKSINFNSLQKGYNKFCCDSSCNVNYYNKYENRHQCGDKISKSLKENKNLQSQKEYWMKNGFTEEQSIKLVKIRQATNSIEAIMKRTGCNREAATETRKDITAKWLKSFPRLNYSKVSQELFWKIYDCIKDKYKEIYFATISNGNKMIDDRNHEYRVRTLKSNRSLDFFIKDINKVIEFDGAYWHSTANKHVNYTIDKDTKRNSEIVDALNCKLYIVKELDYNKDKLKVVEECLKFIANE